MELQKEGIGDGMPEMPSHEYYVREYYPMLRILIRGSQSDLLPTWDTPMVGIDASRVKPMAGVDVFFQRQCI